MRTARCAIAPTTPSPDRVVVAGLLDRVADQDTTLVGLADGDDGWLRKERTRSVAMIWPRCGRTGALSPTIGASRALPMPAASTTLPGLNLAAARDDAEAAGSGLDLVDDMVGQVAGAVLLHPRYGARAAGAANCSGRRAGNSLRRRPRARSRAAAPRPSGARASRADRRPCRAGCAAASGSRGAPPARPRTDRDAARPAAGTRHRDRSRRAAKRRSPPSRPTSAWSRPRRAPCRGLCSGPRPARSCRARRETRRRLRRAPRPVRPAAPAPRRSPRRPARRRPPQRHDPAATPSGARPERQPRFFRKLMPYWMSLATLPPRSIAIFQFPACGTTMRIGDWV